MSKTIYLIMGETGKYEDHTTWPVCAYEDKVMANDHAGKAIAEAKVIIAQCDSADFPFDRWTFPRNMSKYDKHMMIGTDGVDYYVLEIEARETLPE